MEERIDRNLTISTVVIETENGAKTMGKPKGTYITIEASNMDEEDEDYHREISVQLAKVIKKLLPKHKEEMSVLVVGLGNRDVTPDALGPRVVDNLFITRHILKEYGKYAFGEGKVNRISSIVPGVMAQTGMETAQIIMGVVKELKPDCMIVIDALAARSTARLANTIQLSDTGIMPGSGVGNHRNAINDRNMGVPVIALGVPTVVDAATIVGDALEGLLDSMDYSRRKQVVQDFIPESMSRMYVTPKDVDELVKRISFTISEAVNISMSQK